MGKKKKKTKKEAPKQKDTPEEQIEDNPSRFGGLPDRDLKKNLGCGG